MSWGTLLESGEFQLYMYLSTPKLLSLRIRVLAGTNVNNVSDWENQVCILLPYNK